MFKEILVRVISGILLIIIVGGVIFLVFKFLVIPFILNYLTTFKVENIIKM